MLYQLSYAPKYAAVGALTASAPERKYHGGSVTSHVRICQPVENF